MSCFIVFRPFFFVIVAFGRFPGNCRLQARLATASTMPRITSSGDSTDEEDEERDFDDGGRIEMLAFESLL